MSDETEVILSYSPPAIKPGDCLLALLQQLLSFQLDEVHARNMPETRFLKETGFLSTSVPDKG